MQELDGKVAVVTGAGSGIGRALALALAGEGMRVALADIDQDALGQTTQLLVDAGSAAGDVRTQRTDVRLEAAVDALADGVYSDWGRVDVLCSNAGVVVGGPLWERPVADLEFVLGVNLWGILHGIRSFVPRMLAQGGEGHIVHTCSSAGLLSSTFAGPYTISKFAALAATESLAMDLAAIGSTLKVTALCPGYVQTGLAATSMRSRPDELAVEATPITEVVMGALAAALDAGIAPASVATQVVAAIRSEQFLVLTHEHHRDHVLARAERLAANQLPEPGDYS